MSTHLRYQIAHAWRLLRFLVQVPADVMFIPYCAIGAEVTIKPRPPPMRDSCNLRHSCDVPAVRINYCPCFRISWEYQTCRISIKTGSNTYVYQMEIDLCIPAPLKGLAPPKPLNACFYFYQSSATEIVSRLTGCQSADRWIAFPALKQAHGNPTEADIIASL